MHAKTSVFRNPPFLKVAAAATSMLIAGACYAGPFFFSTGNPNGLMATASRPDSTGKPEIESADDFILGSQTTITGATFTGLLLSTSVTSIADVVVEIYRVFPKDSTVPPSGDAPTRVNSPSDVAFAGGDSNVPGELSFTTSILNSSFTAANSVQNGIHPTPNQTTGGEGPVTGVEVLFTVTFAAPFDLPADHYFFVPQVQVTGGDFMWLSAPKPIVSPGTPFTPDLQTWIRNAALDPDWLRIGTDIVGGTTPPTFNAAFTLTGRTVPEPGTLLLVGAGMAALWWRRKRGK